MKTKKSLLLVILSFIAVFALALAFGCKNNKGSNEPNPDEVLTGNYKDEGDVEDQPADNWVLQEITLNTSNVKTEYALGEEFDSEKLPAVTAKFATVDSLIAYENTKLQSENVAEIEYDSKTVTDISVDAGQYNKNAVGTYLIYINYTHAGVTRSDSFPVTVTGGDPAIGGITAVTTDDFVVSYTITSQDGIDISLNGLAFYEVDADLEVSEDAISSEDYTLKYYRNGTEVNGITGVKDKGEYTIMATYKNASAFVTVTVLDPIVSFELKSDAEGAKFTQVQSPENELSSTWVFTVTYTSGKVENLKLGDDGLVIGGLVTVTAGERETTAVFTDESENVSAKVPYTITANEDLTSLELNFDVSKITGLSDSTQMTATDFNGGNSFINLVDGAKVRYRVTYLDTNSVGDAMKITFMGYGTLEVTIRSTGSGNFSSVGVKDADGNYLSAVYGTGIIECQTDDGVVYLSDDSVSTSYKSVLFTIPEGGTYTIFNVSSASANNKDYTCATQTRFQNINVVDVYDKTIDRTSYEFVIDTANVNKTYVAGQTVDDIDLTGIVATFKEIHTVNEDKTTNVTADKLTCTLASGDMDKINSTAVVTVNYTAEDGAPYTATYTINITSPVAIDGTDVNKVVLAKQTASYDLAKDQTTAEISKDDIAVLANDAKGAEIILGAGESVTYKLYSGDTELENWTVEAGTYTIKAVVTLNNTKDEVEGTTVFEASLTVKVNEYKEPTGGTVIKTVNYAVDTSTEIYTMQSDNDTDGIATLTWVSGSATEKNDTAKEIGGINYASCINVNGGGRYITLELTKDIKSIIIACGSANAGRTVGLFSGIVKSASDSSADKALGSLAITENGATGTFTVEDLEAGTYTITAVTTGSTATVRVYGVVIEYEEAAASVSKTVNYAVDTSTEIYTMQSENDTDGVATVAWISGSATEKNDTAKEIGGINYASCINVNGGGRYITLVLTKDVKSITIACGSANAGRTVGLFSGIVKSASDSSEDKALGSLAITENGATGTFTVENLEAGTYTITAVTTGSTATVRVYGFIIEYEVPAAPAGGTVSYAVDSSTEIYTMQSDDDTDEIATVAWVSGSATEKNDGEKTIGDVTYSSAINVNGGGRYITLVLDESVKSAKVTVACGSSNAGRSIGLFEGIVKSASDSSEENALGSATIDTAGGTDTFTVENLSAGTYTITAVTTGSTATVRVYGIIIEYEL